jgi:DNA-directed RNA polymerase specialized sigma24 family protein
MITPAFEAVWPDVERRLRALLFRRGLDRASADDVVQEVALRALANHVTYASATDLLRWAGPVACNLHVDLVRHRARMLDAPEAEDHPAADDVPREVAHRIELQRAFRGIAALRPADREAIIDAVAAEPVVPRTRKEAVRLAVRRHRARSRLAIVLEQLAAWLTGLGVIRRGRRLVAVAALVPAAAIPLIATWHVPPAAGEARTRPAVVAPAVGDVASSTALVRETNARTAPNAARPAAAGRVTVRPATSPATRRPAVTLDGPRGVRTSAGTDARRPDDHVLCVKTKELPVDRVCVL